MRDLCARMKSEYANYYEWYELLQEVKDEIAGLKKLINNCLPTQNLECRKLDDTRRRGCEDSLRLCLDNRPRNECYAEYNQCKENADIALQKCLDDAIKKCNALKEALRELELIKLQIESELIKSESVMLVTLVDMYKAQADLESATAECRRKLRKALAEPVIDTDGRIYDCDLKMHYPPAPKPPILDPNRPPIQEPSVIRLEYVCTGCRS